jgi:hypothetical protein
MGKLGQYKHNKKIVQFCPLTNLKKEEVWSQKACTERGRSEERKLVVVTE